MRTSQKTSSLPHANLLELKTITFRTESKLLFRFQQEQTLIPRAQKRTEKHYSPSNCPMPPSRTLIIIDITHTNIFLRSAHQKKFA